MYCELSTIRQITNHPAIVHCASNVVFETGNSLCVWYECTYETATDSVIRASYRDANETEWSTPITLFNFHGMGLGNPVLWLDDNEHVHIIFVALYEKSWTKGFIFYAVSGDQGKHWSAPTLLLAKQGFMPKTRPLQNAYGQWLFPLYHEAERCPYIWIVDDLAQPLAGTLTAETMARGNVIQPCLVALDNERLLLLGRSNRGTIWQSHSYNAGMSWSICQPTDLPNPDSAVDMAKLPCGDIALVCNPDAHHRQRLQIMLSTDEGKHWYAQRLLVSGTGEYAYPSLFITNEGKLYISYTENRYRIQHVVIDKAWIVDGD